MMEPTELDKLREEFPPIGSWQMNVLMALGRSGYIYNTIQRPVQVKRNLLTGERTICDSDRKSILPKS